jgi:hypothetical protein
MPDTGAPWNIPYVDPTDLVRDYPQASEDLADAIADGLDAAGNAGIGSNVGQGVLTAAFNSSSASFTDVTSLEVTITPSSATSKVLLIANVSYTNDGSSGSERSTSFRFLRGATAIGIGDASSSRTQASFGSPQEESGSNNVAPNGAMTFLDSPATTDATTYKLQVRVQSGTVRVNVYQTDFTDARSLALISSLTAIEVAA